MALKLEGVVERSECVMEIAVIEIVILIIRYSFHYGFGDAFWEGSPLFYSKRPSISANI